MAATKTGRFEIYEWTSAGDEFSRTQMTESHQVLKARAAGFVTTQETVDTDLNGYFYYTSTDGTDGVLKYCNGVDWFTINQSGTVVSLDGTTSDGSGTTFALANHKHALDDSIVTTAKINDSAVTTAKITDSAVTTEKINDASVTNDKLAASGLDASKLTTGTLPTARIASGSISNSQLAASGFDAGKLTTGTLPIDRIADNAVTTSKMAQVAAHGILVRAAGTTGNLSTLTAGTNSVLNRGASGNLQFTTVTDDMLAGSISSGKITSLDAAKLTGSISGDRIPDDTITYGKMQDTSGGNVVLGKSGSAGTIAEISISNDRVLGKDGSGNIGSTQVKTNMIADDAVTNAKIADNAVALGTQTTGTYVGTVSAGSGISVTTSGTEPATATVTHATYSTTASTNAQNGQAITALTVSNGHVSSYTYYDMDDRFPAKASSYTNSSGGGYWITYGINTPNNSDNAPDGSIYLQYA